MASGKRNATSDLNHNNWDEDEEPEVSGSFAKASEDILKNRVIKVAKRRNPIGSLATSTPVIEPEKKGAFASFGGFSKMPVSSTTSSFSFLSNVTSSSAMPKTNGLGLNNTTTLVGSSTSDKPKEYYAKIKGLNQSVSSWIKKHVDTNPFLNLTPIFRDYEKYFEEIEHLNSDLVTTKIVETNTITDETNKTSLFGNVKNAETPMFSIGKINTPASNAFSFGLNAAKPFTFTNVEKPVDDNNEQDSEEPPKVEFTPVIEDGHIYTVRCKVFVKKGDTYGDRGVGTLFLKPIPNNDKIQLVVRADTNLGSLLCNFILSSNIPMQRMGKKDVMLVCIPLPENKPPPVPVLLRVKSPDEADELLNTLEKHKK